MSLGIFFIPVTQPGKLALLPHPRTGNSSDNNTLKSELNALRTQGIDRLVSLLTNTESHDLGLANEAALFTALGGEFTAFPIPDMCLPDQPHAFMQLACTLADDIVQGRHIAIHCRAGIGRSGMLGCSVLHYLGMNIDNALAHIGKYRGLRIPDTCEQENWLRQNLPTNQ